jgi:transcriptional regulator GlxA family with amidase domain
MIAGKTLSVDTELNSSESLESSARKSEGPGNELGSNANTRQATGIEDTLNGAPEWEGNAARQEISRKIAQSIAYMRENVDRPLQAAALAAQAHVSVSHYFALFKQQTGCTPIDYFIQLRMQRACILLRDTSLSVKEVAAALGYEDPFYFSRVFKLVNSVAPSYYRTKGNS